MAMTNLDYGALAMLVEEFWDNFVELCGNDEEAAELNLAEIQKLAGMR